MAIPKNKTIINIDDYTGFRWHGKHTSQLGLTIVSSSSRYSLNPISTITNNTIDVPGGDGQYFFNATYGPKKWTVNFSFDNLDDYQWRELLNWLYHKSTSDLVFDELPYKAYNAKLEGTPVVNYLCFDEVKAKKDDNSLDINTLETFDWATYDSAAPASPSYITHDANGDNFDTMYYKKRIYKGEGTLNFVAFFPYAYSARDYNGKYMKYLDRIEYFPNLAEQYSGSINVGNTASITVDEKAVIEIMSISGNTIINRDNQTVERGAIGETTEGRLTLYKKDEIWNYFQLVGEDEENNEEYVFFDSCGDTKDTIEFVKDESNSGRYVFNKKVGCYNLLTNDYFKLLINSQDMDSFENENEELEFRLDLKNIKDIFDSIKVSDEEADHPERLILDSNQFVFISKEDDDEDTEKPSRFYVSKLSKKEDKITSILLVFKTKVKQIRQFQKIISNTETSTEESLIAQTANQCLLFYPSQEKVINIVDYKKNSDPLTEKASPDSSITMRIKNQLASQRNPSLEFQVDYNITPVLYDNFDEWKDSSGLLPSKITTNENYDDCIKVKDTQSTFGYKVYNGGDLPTPFRLTYPVPPTPLTDSDNEITFVLAQKREITKETPVGKREVTFIMDLEKGVPYSKSGEDGSYYYYFYEITDYNSNKANFLNIKTGDFEEIELQNKIYKRLSPQEKIQALDSFTIRFNTSDSLNSYGELIKNYTIAAAQDKQGQYFTNKLEIDTYKQTINFIATSTITGKETIIPIYFTLLHGSLFRIPPKVDNLYVLVYNNREKNNPFINNNIKSNPEIEYRYLYL